MERYYTMKQAADILGVTRMTVYRHAKRWNLRLAQSKYDRREYAISQAQLDYLNDVLNGQPQPMEEDEH